MKEYVFKYKCFGMPYYYEFKTIAENTDKATTAFFKEYPIGIERFYIAFVFDI